MENLNEFVVLRSDVRHIIENIPYTTKKKLLDMIQPLDILVVGTPRIPGLNRFEKVTGSISSTIQKIIQGSEYNSCKIVSLDKQYIYAYGLDPLFGLQHEEKRFSKYPLKDYIRIMRNGCLVRVPNLEYDQKLKMQRYLNSKLGLSYNTSEVVKIGWNKLIKYLPFLKIDIEAPENKEELIKMKDGLICSTIISMAFIYGANIKLTENPMEVWPNDFISSSETQKIARIDY